MSWRRNACLPGLEALILRSPGKDASERTEIAAGERKAKPALSQDMAATETIEIMAPAQTHGPFTSLAVRRWRRGSNFSRSRRR
jgi:hypothetical protein